MADAAAKSRSFRKYTFRGVDLDQLLDMSSDQLVELFHARARRRFQRGLKRKPLALIKKLRKAKKEAEHGEKPEAIGRQRQTDKAKKEAEHGEKPEAVRTHLRNMIGVSELRKAKKEAGHGKEPQAVCTHLRNVIAVPKMIGSVIGVYNGKTFNQVEIKPEMVGYYLAEFSISYKPCRHGRPGLGGTAGRFIPLR
eukprot:gene27430-4730_t